MKCLVLLNSSLEKYSQEEIKRLLNINSVVSKNVVEFDAEKEELVSFLTHSQASRRVLVSLAREKELGALDFTRLEFPWQDFFTNELSFKIQVEGVKGQENRITLAKDLAGKLFAVLSENGINPKLEMKHPDFLIIVYFNGEKYFVGIDLSGEEMNSRDYRVFAHPASFKGDLAYHLIRYSGFQKNEQLLVGFMKDGVLAVEAALFVYNLPVHREIAPWSFQKFPLFKGIVLEMSKLAENEIKISAFDQTTQNLTAARKNVALAGVKDLVSVHKYSLEDLDVKFYEGSFNRIIMQITKKDEDKLNEIYYQVSFLLKKGGTVLIVGRETWEFSVSSKFSLIKEEVIQRGDSIHKLWLLEKK